MENINKISQLFWNNKIKDKDPIDKLNGNLKSFNLSIESHELSFFGKITNNNILSQFSVISSIYSILLYKYFDNYTGIITSYNSLISSKDNNPFFLEDNSNLLKKTYKEHLQAISKEVQNNLAYAEYDSTFLNLDSYSNFAITLNNPLISEDKCKGVLLSFNITNEILELKVFYDESFVEKSLMQHFGLNFTKFLIHLQELIDKDVNEFDFLTEEERHKLLVEFNDTKVDYPKDKTIIQLFEKQVERTSENVAIVFEDTELTYSELNEEANQLGDYLRQNYNIQPDDLIAIKLERSEKMIIAIVGILKSGAAYVPVDPSYPQERIDYIEKDTKAKVTIDNAFFETFESKKANYTKENLAIISKPNSLAYVIYTSGTTGQPKGVMIENSGLVNRLTWMQKAYPLNGLETLIQKTTYSFDVSVWELLWWSVNGAKLSIPKSGSEKDPAELIQSIYKNSVTVIHFVPSMLSVFLEFIKGDSNQKAFLKTLKQVFVSGEALTLHQRKLFYSELPHISLMNLYGPTEASIDVSYYDCAEHHNLSSIPIGKPIDNTSLYILDEKLDLIPIGVVGKLYISGTGLSRGYLNKQELTAEKFIDNPFEMGTKMYNTGDLARWLPDGNIEFLGRKDFQVKIRGFRIELGEIENAIFEFSEDLKQVVVDVKESNKDKALVAYLASTATIDKSALRNFLQNSLPDYMIPSFYVVLESLPLTPNGKIDRKALPNVEGEDVIRKEYSAPSTKIEEILATIWQEVLGVDKIGVTDNFFDLGGHSLMISQVINRIHKQLGKTISFKIFFANPNIKALSKQLKESEYLAIPKAMEALAYPLTASQSRLWVLSQLEGGSLAYNMSAAVKLTGVVDFEKFEESFQLLIQRHEILRTYFKTNEEGEVQQYILPFEKVDFKIVAKDFSKIENQGDEVAYYLEDINSSPFDLEKAPLVRASMIKIKEEESIFFLSLHHIIGDGWSIELLISEVVKTYNDLEAGRSINLPELSIQYKDYAVWLNGELHQEQYIESENYWLQKFEGELPVLDLPSFKKRPLVQTYNGNSISHQFSTTFLDRLKIFSKEQDVTLFMTLMSGIKTLLYRYTGQDDIVVGTPIAGREHPDLENQMGLFLNTLAIRTQFKEKISFLELLTAQKDNLLAAYDHQKYPFDALVGKLNLKRDTSRSGLFDVLVVLQNQSQLNNLNNNASLSDIEISDYEFKSKTAQLDVSFTFVETENLGLTIEHNTDIYDKYLIERMFSHFENLLTQSIEQPNCEIQNIDYLTKDEKQQVLFDFNDTKVDYPKDKTIIDLLEEQVAKTPNNIAVIFEEIELTYKELNEKSNQLGAYLRENYQVNSDDLIGIKLERSEQMIIAILGILKSGAAYVPIDINYPQARIAYIEKDSNAKIIVDEKTLEIFYKNQERYSKLNVSKINITSDLAYVIYTSGTTGNPKGVMVEHRNTVELINWSKLEFNLSKFDIVYAVTSYCFDLSIYEIFYTLSTGKKIRLLKNAFDISHYLEKDNNVLINTVPSVIRKLLDDNICLHNVCNINMAGEILPADIISKLPLDKIETRNLYGPSEDTTYSTSYLIQNQEYRTVLIGKPISNSQVYILDDYLQPLPIGVTGRLYVSGVGVARGYLNKPELTNEKFISNPFIEGTRMYDTGDLGRWLPDGNIEFLGRKDFQVKIRGYRIELEEIETNISQYSQNINQVVVDVKKVNGENVLACYYTKADETEIDKIYLREYLQSKLPEYMVPSFFLEIEFIPLTPNGKIDRKALPSVTGEDLIRNEYVAPRNETEQKLAEIWQEVLGLEKVGITDNFFELGGHSLILAQVLNRINQNLAKQISFKDFFDNPTIEGITKKLIQIEFSTIPKASKQRDYPLTPTQSALWIKEQLTSEKNIYNIVTALEINGNLNFQKLEQSFAQLIVENEVLRTSFSVDHGGEVRQYIHEDITEFKIIKVGIGESLEELVKIEFSTPFDLLKPPLLRVYLQKLSPLKHNMILSIHHLVSDGWSMLLIKQKLVDLYFNKEEQKSIIQFKDYATWLAKELVGDKISKQRAFWLNKFDAINGIVDLPKSRNNKYKDIHEGETFNYVFSKETIFFINKLKTTNKVTLFTVLLSAVKCVLYKHTNQKNIVVGVPYANRNSMKTEQIIGPFLNTYLIHSEFNKNSTFSNLIKHVNNNLIEAYQNNLCPLEDWSAKLKTRAEDLFNIMVVLQNFIDLFEFKNADLAFKDLNMNLKPTAQYDIVFRFADYEDGLNLNVEYKVGLFEREYIENIIKHFEILVRNFCETENAILDEIECITSQEELRLLEFNNTQADYPKNDNFIDIFNKRVAKTPAKIAVRYCNSELTYKELNEFSDQFSNYLLDNNEIKKGDRVCVKLDKSHELIYVLLGIIKTGACYVPIDPNYPEDRKKYLEEVSLAKYSVDNSILKDFIEKRQYYTYKPKKVFISASDIFHIMFTSGSTGKPKGVMLTHRNIVNFVSTNDYFELNENTVLLSTVSTSFDTTNLEFWGCLVNGGELILADKNDLFDYDKFKDILKYYKVNSLWLTASWFSQVVNDNIQIFEGLQQFISGGDILSSKHINKLKEKYPDLIIINGYGPTENTTFSTTFRINEFFESNLPIGKPLKNTKVYILNNSLKKQPIWIPGKIYLSGDNLTKGYFNNKELTQEKYMNNPYEEGCFYNTGDVGRWLPNGDIEFIGREDFQVKIRGHRIELEEIELEIYKYSPFIKQVIVDTRDTNHEKQLAMYVVLSSQIILNELKAHLESYLPNYMIPSVMLIVEKIPLTPNGKVDRIELSKIPIKQSCYTPPANQIQRDLVNIWERTLHLSNIGIEDNFFDLGGDSLSIIKIIHEIKKKFQIAITFKEFYTERTITKISTYIDKGIKENDKIPLVSLQEYYELSNAQKRIWLLSQSRNVSISYNNPLRLKIHTNFETLKKAISSLIEVNEIFRTRFIIIEGKPVQQIIPFFEVDIDKIIQKVGSSNFENIVAEELRLPFDFEQGALIKVICMEGDNQLVSFINIHHILIDGWSFSILINQLDQLIFGKTKTLKLNQFKVQYKDFSAWQNNRLRAGQLDYQLEFWKSTFVNFRQMPLSTDFKRKYSHNFQCETLSFELDKVLVEAIRLYLTKNELTRFMFYSSVISWIICHKYKRRNLVIGTLDANRDHIDISDQIGFFANTLPIPMNIDHDNFEQYINHKKEKIINAFDHKEYPFDLIVEAIKPEKNGSRLPFFDIMVIVQNNKFLFENKNNFYGEYFKKENAKADIIFEFINETNCQIHYDSSLYKQVTIEDIVIEIKYFLNQKFLKNNKKVNMSKLKTTEVNLDLLERTQVQVYEMLKEILPNKIIGLNDNFFELGGNSMDLMGLVIKISEEFQVSIGIEEIIEEITISNLSKIIIEKRDNNGKENK